LKEETLKKLTFALITATLVVGFAGSVILKAQDEMSEDQMMQMMMKYGTPGEGHKKLDGMTGSWTFTSKWWADPKAHPELSNGTCESNWILGGRFVQENVTGDMMGQPFHGMGLTGYDNYGEKYQMFWIDEMATCFMIADGTIDKGGKVITFTGSYDDYMTGKKDKPFKGQVEFVDSNTRIYRAFEFPSDGEPFVSFEVTYKRSE